MTTVLHPKIEGVWARQIAAYGEVKIEHAWPHGDDAASWTFPAGTAHRALHAGATVEIYDGGLRVWKGILQEPGVDGSMSARGLWTEGQDALAVDSLGRVTTNPDWAVNDSITRGALTWNTTRQTTNVLLTTPLVADEKTIFSVAGLLDQWTAKEGLRWGVFSGEVAVYADPKTPRWHVPQAASGRGLTPADDDFATHLYGVYLVDTETRAMVSVGDEAARSAYGRRVERTVDLTNLGPIDATAATNALQNTLALSAARLRFADGLDLRAGQITTPGGTPAPLSQVRAGQVVRLHGVKDPRGVNGIQNYTDVLIGKSAFNTDTQTLSIAPVDAAPRGLGDALGTSSGSGAASGVEARPAGSGSVRISGEFTLNSGSLAPGAESGIVAVTHNLGVPVSLVIGHLEDTGSGWAHEIGWRVQDKNATQVLVRFRNNGPNQAQALLRFRLVY